jgi:hypothetical protein
MTDRYSSGLSVISHRSKVYRQIDFCLPAGPVPIASAVRAFLIITKGQVQEKLVFQERGAEMILSKELSFLVRAVAAAPCSLDLRFT